MGPIKTLWESYKNEVLPKNASATQINETEMAFYAGGAAIYKILSDLVENNDHTQTQANALFLNIEREILDYSAQLASKAKGAH